MTREETQLLTKIGYLYLKRLGCFAISTEVGVWTASNLRDYSNKQDRHRIIDLIVFHTSIFPMMNNMRKRLLRGKLRIKSMSTRKRF